MDLTVSPVTAGQWPALADLFGRAGASNGCWCMYWRIGPRYKDRPREENKRDLEQLARSGRPPGLLAFAGDIAVGWCELAPRAELDWLARGRYFMFLGVASTFARHGFEVVARRQPDRPMMRRAL
jgi:hypothetical protein